MNHGQILSCNIVLACLSVILFIVTRVSADVENLFELFEVSDGTLELSVEDFRLQLELRPRFFTSPEMIRCSECIHGLSFLMIVLQALISAIKEHMLTLCWPLFIARDHVLRIVLSNGRK